jgi:hypothetical protein
MTEKKCTKIYVQVLSAVRLLFARVYKALHRVSRTVLKMREPGVTVRGLSPVHSQEERIFRHCTVINELYRTYEEFVESILEFWLLRVPRYLKFSQLDNSLHNAYRHGMSRIIKDHRYGLKESTTGYNDLTS